MTATTYAHGLYAAQEAPPRSVVLRPYQAKAGDEIRAAMAAARRADRKPRVVLCAPTGSGKTEMAIDIMQKAVARGHRALFVVDRLTLMDQTIRRLAGYGVRAGQHGDGRDAAPGLPVVVSMAQTLRLRPPPGAPFGLALLDECHERHEGNAALMDDMGIDPVIGLTATPYTPGLANWYEAGVVNLITTNDLIAGGWLTPYRTVLSESSAAVVAALDKLEPMTTGEWRTEDIDAVLEMHDREVVAEWERWNPEARPTLVFCSSIAQAESTLAEFRARGHAAGICHSRMPARQVKANIAAFATGRVRVLCSVDQLTKGFDVPEAAVLIARSPLRRSINRKLQIDGRVMRGAAGKTEALVIDCVGNQARFAEQTRIHFQFGCLRLPPSKEKADPVSPEEILAEEQEAEALAAPWAQPAMIEEPMREVDMGLFQAAMQEFGGLSPAEKMKRLKAACGSEAEVWDAICTYASNKSQRGHSMARGAWRSITGGWPRRRYAPNPDIALADLPAAIHAAMDWSYAQWKAQRGLRT